MAHFPKGPATLKELPRPVMERKRLLAVSGTCALLLAPSAGAQQPNYDESKVPDYTLPEPLAHGRAPQPAA